MEEGMPLRVFLYRFITGMHLDGLKREAHERNTWWTALGRHHRAAWRVIPIVVVITWVWLHKHYPYWTTEVSGMLAPFAIDRLFRVFRKRARPKKVHKVDVRAYDEPAPFQDHDYRPETRRLMPEPSMEEPELDEIDLGDFNIGPVDLT